MVQITAGRRFGLIGSSYGGYLALGLVRAIPEHLLGAALLVPDLPDGDGERDTPEHQTIVEAPGAFSDLADDEQWVPGRLVEQSRRAVLEIREHEMPAAMREADHDWLERLEAGGYQLPVQLASAERPFPHPSLIVTGRQDATVGYEQAWRLRDEFHARDAGHARYGGTLAGADRAPCRVHRVSLDSLKPAWRWSQGRTAAEGTGQLASSAAGRSRLASAVCSCSHASVSDCTWSSSVRCRVASRWRIQETSGEAR